MLDPGGSVNTLFLCTFTLLSFFNLFIVSDSGFTGVELATLVLPFVILAGLSFLIKNNKYYSFVYLFIAIFTTIKTPNISDFSGVLGFIFAFHLIRNKKYGLMLIMIAVMSITVRLITMDETIPRSIAMLFIFGFWGMSYYYVIYKSMPKSIKDAMKSLTKDENKLLELMSEGWNQEPAGKELGHKNKQTSSLMMRGIKEKLGIDQSLSSHKATSMYVLYGKNRTEQIDDKS